jgi:hypothetical protein
VKRDTVLISAAVSSAVADGPVASVEGERVKSAEEVDCVERSVSVGSSRVVAKSGAADAVNLSSVNLVVEPVAKSRAVVLLSGASVDASSVERFEIAVVLVSVAALTVDGESVLVNSTASVD